MKKEVDVKRTAIDNMKNIILDELGVDIIKSKIKRYDVEYIEKRLETFK